MILITTCRVIFTPSKEVKDELLATKIFITCYDKDGNIVKRVTSTSFSPLARAPFGVHNS